MKTKLFIIFALAVLIIILLFSKTRETAGDINNDGSINIVDIVLVVDIILNDGAGYGDYELWASDVNSDAETNISDLIIIVEVILGTQEECPPGNAPCTDNLTECCLDSTSHAFEWIIDSLGTYGSELRDVAIINEDSIWVVGEIKIADSTGITSYGGALWDGSEWHLKHFYYIDQLALVRPRGVWPGSNNDLWLASGSIFYFDGDTTTLVWLLPEMGHAVYNVWGASPTVLYFVGPGGTIVHYNGTEYTEMESGTDIELNDVDGSPNGEYVFIAGRNDSGESVALMIYNNNVEILYEGEDMFSEPYGGIKVVSVQNDTAYFASQMGLWKYNYLMDSSTFIPSEDIYFTNRGIRSMDVQSINDLSIITYWSELIHLNGSNWYLDTTILDYFGPYNIQAKGMDFKEDLIVPLDTFGRPLAHLARGYRE